jgi:hypothetical protein
VCAPNYNVSREANKTGCEYIFEWAAFDTKVAGRAIQLAVHCPAFPRNRSQECATTSRPRDCARHRAYDDGATTRANPSFP